MWCGSRRVIISGIFFAREFSAYKKKAGFTQIMASVLLLATLIDWQGELYRHQTLVLILPLLLFKSSINTKVQDCFGDMLRVNVLFGG